MIRKLRHKIKVKDEDSFKLEEVAEPAKEDCESKQHLNDIESKDLQSVNKETHPIQDDAPAETFVDEKIVLAEKVSSDEEDTKVQKQVQLQSCQRIKHTYLRRINFMLLMKLRLALKMNFTARKR